MLKSVWAFVSATALLAAAAAPGYAADTSATATTESPTSGTFTALTYNIAGLPEFLSSAESDRESATTEIGERLGPFELINVQEDFNYHAYLYESDDHPYRTPTTGGAGIGSGLNSLLSYEYSELDRVTWDDCSLNSGDCLTPKGFTFHRARLGEGIYLDVYNLHTDAGDSSDDLAARSANLAQLTTYIQTYSAGNAVIVMGDTNTRYTRSGDTISQFADDNGLTDAWVQLARGGTEPESGTDALLCAEDNPGTSCEVVDKILYRGSTLLSLNATEYTNLDADFRTEDGVMLSDHFPIAAEFSWTLNQEFRTSDVFGGPHGTPFTDIDAVPAGARAASISLRAGERVDQMGMTLTDGTALTHGGGGGSAQSLTLGSDEYVTSVRLCQGEHEDHTRIFYAQYTTNQGRTLAGGTATSDCVTRTAPSGWQVAGFHGRAGDEVDSLGLIYTAR